MQVLPDAQWERFEAAIAAAGIRGARPRVEERRPIEAIIWRLDNGAKWRAIPAELGPVAATMRRLMASVAACPQPEFLCESVDRILAMADTPARRATSWTVGRLCRIGLAMEAAPEGPASEVLVTRHRTA